MGWSLNIGSVAGTAIRIHVTFLLFLAWIFGGSYVSGGAEAAWRGLLFMVLLFLCVLLHEFGHIFTARKFGVMTPDVILLPIGGVARLERIPEKPSEEFLIAIAGPAVNVAIAAVLVLLAGAHIDPNNLGAIESSKIGLAERLAVVNVFLALFNLIPAFPMDGGRVLRALLATRFGYVRATEIAASVGQFVAFVLGFVGLFGDPLLIFIAVFVYLAAASEAHLVAIRAISQGVPVTAAMLTEFVTLTPDEHVDAAVETLLHTSQGEFPVVDGLGRPVGLLARTDVIRALKERGPDAKVGDVMGAEIPTLGHRHCLDEAFRLLQQKSAPAVGIVNASQRLVGLVTSATVGEMLMVHRAMPGGLRSGPWAARPEPDRAACAGISATCTRSKDCRGSINHPPHPPPEGAAPSPQPGATVVELIMSSGVPNRPPLAMKFWLFRRVSGAEKAARGQSADRIMSIESLEHIMRNRMRMVLRHSWLVAVIGTLAVIGAAWAAFYFSTEAERLRVAVGPNDAKFVEALSDQIAQSHRNLHLKLVAVAGPREAADDIKNGKADLAILPSPANESLKAPVVAILRQNVMALIVPAPASGKKAKKSAKIEKIDQLAGHRVGIVTGNEASPELLRAVLDHYGVPAAKLTVSEIDPNNIAEAIKNNQVDVLFVAGAATGAAISGAVKAATRNGEAPSFVAIDQADGIAKRNVVFDSIDIDAGTFGGTPPTPDDSLKSLSFAEYLVARKSTSDSIVAALAKTIYSSRQALAAAMPGEIKIEAPSTDKDADVVVHSGALAYLNDSQQSFFDRYGDDIFYGMLIFPVFGSALAGLASYFRRDTRTRRLRLLQRVLDLVRKAHAAQTLEALEQLQVEADNLVIAIVHQGEREEFDETVRMSFAFALDQLRFAIAGRRTAILDRGGEAADSDAAKATGAKPPDQAAAA